MDKKTVLEQKELLKAIESLEKWLAENLDHKDREKVQRQLCIKYVKLKVRKDAERRQRKSTIYDGIQTQYIPLKYNI